MTVAGNVEKKKRERERVLFIGKERERVLFIGTQFSILKLEMLRLSAYCCR